MDNLREKIYSAGLIPVIKIDKIESAVPLANALKNGGISVLEVTFRTSIAGEAIKLIKQNCEGITLIAGTVLSVEQAQRAIECGAEAIVAPGLNPQVVKYCIANDIPVVPGIQTPTEIETAMSYGLEFVKFFPSEAAGGLKMLKALSAPYSNMVFMPTGGIDESNILDYLAFGKVVACGGTFMISEDFALVEKKTKEIVEKIKQVRVK